MFFWVVLGSLVSLITWGKISENAQSPDNHVVPVYEALVSSMSVQNKIASEYVETKLREFERTRAAVGTGKPVIPSDSGVLFKVTAAGKIDPASNAELATGGAYVKPKYEYVKLADGFKSAYFCVRANEAEEVVVSNQLADIALCSLSGNGNAVLMTVTYGRLRGAYSTNNLQYFFKAAARAEPGAKRLGVLRRVKYASGVLTEINDRGKTVTPDDASVLYRVHMPGVTAEDSLYLPKGVVEALKTSEGLTGGKNLDGYFIAVDVLRYKGAACLIHWDPVQRKKGCL